MRTTEKIRLLMMLLLLIAAGASYFLRDRTVAASAEPLRLSGRTKEAHCVVNGPYPDPACTPGAVFPVTAEQVCTPGYAGKARNVSAAEKKSVYEEYGLAYPQAKGTYEADHFIPLELGGSNDIANLFPEVAVPAPGFHEKDLVENFLHQEVCGGRMPLSEAQREISADWLKVYQSLSPWQIHALKGQF